MESSHSESCTNSDSSNSRSSKSNSESLSITSKSIVLSSSSEPQDQQQKSTKQTIKDQPKEVKENQDHSQVIKIEPESKDSMNTEMKSFAKRLAMIIKELSDFKIINNKLEKMKDEEVWRKEQISGILMRGLTNNQRNAYSNAKQINFKEIELDYPKKQLLLMNRDYRFLDHDFKIQAKRNFEINYSDSQSRKRRGYIASSSINSLETIHLMNKSDLSQTDSIECNDLSNHDFKREIISKVAKKSDLEAQNQVKQLNNKTLSSYSNIKKFKEDSEPQRNIRGEIELK